MPLIASLALVALAQTDWKPYTLGGFGFLLPLKPVAVADGQGIKDSLYWQSANKGMNGILVGVATIPETKPPMEADQVIGADVDSVVKGYKGTVLSISDALVQGWPAVDYRMKQGDGTYAAERIVMVGQKMVQIIVRSQTEAGMKAPFEQAIAGFTLGSAGKGPLSLAGPTFKRQPLGLSGAVVDLPRYAKDQTSGSGLIRHQFTAVYGNRAYIASYYDAGEVADIPGEELIKALQRANDSAVEGMGAKGQPSSDASLDGIDAVRTFATGDSDKVLRIESALHGGKMFTLIAIVPSVWKNSPEVKAFFASFHFTAPKIPDKG